MDIEIEANQVMNNKISVVIHIGANSNVKEVWFSYIVFSPSSIPFASYGGIAAEVNFEGTIYSSISTIIYYSENIIFGLSKFKFSLDKSFEYQSEIDKDFILGYYVSGNTIDLSISYLAFGIPPARLCSNCSENNAYQEKCVSKCPSDTYPFSYRDRGIGCRTCSPKLNEILNAEKTGCVCMSGSSRVNGKCKRTDEQITTFFQASSSSSTTSFSVETSGTSGGSSGTTMPPKPKVRVNSLTSESCKLK